MGESSVSKGFGMGCGCFLFIIFLIVVCCLAMTFCTVGTVGVLNEAVKVSSDTNTPTIQPPASSDTDKNNPATGKPPIAPTQTNDQAAAVPPPPLETPKPVPIDFSNYRGTEDKNFAKDWVVVDGAKIEGIISVTATPHAMIVILYSAGNKNVPATKLPQGFLDAWNLAPWNIKAAENQ